MSGGANCPTHSASGKQRLARCCIEQLSWCDCDDVGIAGTNRIRCGDHEEPWVDGLSAPVASDGEGHESRPQ